MEKLFVVGLSRRTQKLWRPSMILYRTKK